MTKVILIDVNIEKVSDFAFEGNIPSQLRDYLNGYVEAAYDIGNRNIILVDDSGILKIGQFSKWFLFKGAHQPFAGNGVIIGLDEVGNYKDVTISAKDVRDKITFLNNVQTLKEIFKPKVYHF